MYWFYGFHVWLLILILLIRRLTSDLVTEKFNFFYFLGSWWVADTFNFPGNGNDHSGVGGNWLEL
jgi:hypothetical protein